MSVKGLRVSVPLGMDAALEGLARAVLREQPSDIYMFAADHFESLLQKRQVAAHNAGISPSSTQESNSKQPISEDGTKPIQEERSITEEPESNDTSYGVEATAVRTLAATTGTVAILGTTAKTADKKEEGSSEAASPVVVDTIPEEQEEPPSSVEQAVVHEEDKRDSKASEKSSRPATANSRPTSSHLEENDKKEAADPSPPASSNEPKESTPSETSEAIKSPLPNSNKIETTSPEVKSPVSPPEETESKNTEEIASESVVSESTKDKEEDISKSISSERLKTNSLSNTTLSSDSIAEIENASVKQSPSVEKVIESFDSSSTVEFVDIATKDSPKADGTHDDTATNPARSISSDLSNKAILPVDGDKTPDVTSPVEPEEKLYEEELPPPPPLGTEDTLEAQSSNNAIQPPPNLEKTEISEDNSVKETDQEEVDANSLLKDQLQNEEPSLNSELTSNTSNSIQSVLKNEEAQNINSKSALENNSPNASEEVKAETGSPFSTDNNSSLNDNGDASPVKTVTSSPTPEISEDHKEDIKPDVAQSGVPDKSEITPELTNGLASRNETPIEKTPVNEQISKPSVEEVINITDDTESKTPGNEIIGEIPDDVFGSPIDLTDEKVVAAATTIQATFRGFQTRQNLKADEKVEINENPVLEPVENEVKKSAEIVEETPLNSVSEGFGSTTEQPSSVLEDVDDKMIAAATTIQANFRGYQTRQILQNRDSALPTSEDTNQSSERKTPTALTPELIESVKEEVDDICKEAEIIAAERAESVEGMVAGVHQVVVEAKESTLPSVSESVQAVRGSVTPPSVSDAGAEDVDNYDGKEEVFDSLPIDEKTVHAATTIQASFRGFQVRKNLQDNQEQPDSMPDYPPPAEDDLMPSLDDLPPPDFEALESSYSEDAPTEPLAPPPPPDSVIFNEEDEDELMSLQQLQRPPECDELPEHRLTVDTDSSESSLSSAATKIQAGVRGYLTRKQMQAQGDTGGTTSTSTNVLDSDQSLSVSREDDGVRSAISTEEESEVCRHVVSPDSDTLMEMEVPRSSRSATKRMSLGSSTAELPPARQRAPLRSAISVQGPVPVSDDEVWNTLKGEMSDAATRIQSNFRGYRARKQLQREDAMQVTSSSSQATGSSGSPAGDAGRVSAASENRDIEETAQTARSSGEYHDIIALTPPSIQAEGGGADAAAAAVAGQPADDADPEMVKRRAEDDPKEAAAATKIQATFRGFKTRQELKDVDQAAAKIQAGFRGYKVRKEMKEGRSRRSSNPEQGETPQRIQHSGSVEESAATKIQAGVRGFLVRRKYQKEQDAATKIQAGFRGYHSRKQATN